jgi:hypothetical protein
LQELGNLLVLLAGNNALKVSRGFLFLLYTMIFRVKTSILEGVQEVQMSLNQRSYLSLSESEESRALLSSGCMEVDETVDITDMSSSSLFP